MEWPAKLRAWLKGQYGARTRLAQDLGVPQRTFDKWIYHDIRPLHETETATRIARIRGWSPSWFLNPATRLPPVPDNGDEAVVLLAMKDPERLAVLAGVARDLLEAPTRKRRARARR